MWDCTVKKSECQRIDVFELWCWRRLLSVTWTARRSNLFILRRPVLGVHWKDWCWSWNSNTLTTSCKELTHWKRPWCWDGLRAGGGGDDRGWDGWMVSPTRWAWVWVNSRSWWWTEMPGILLFMGSQSWTWLSDCAELNWGFTIQMVSLSELSINPKFAKRHKSFPIHSNIPSYHISSLVKTSTHTQKEEGRMRAGRKLYIFFNSFFSPLMLFFLSRI